ncbi:hypothetical protein OIO90_005856 [Microbotryomycetes sp. JL221]|nr:hypothetical protein OIO90_005856 [Microbotryomycetes sp. JL221]
MSHSNHRCLPSWAAFGYNGHSPCRLAEMLMRNCGPTTRGPSQPYLLPQLDVYRGERQYPAPTIEQANQCVCSMPVYNLVQACAACQSNPALDVRSMAWSAFTANCMQASIPAYQSGMRDEYPRWAWKDNSQRPVNVYLAYKQALDDSTMSQAAANVTFVRATETVTVIGIAATSIASNSSTLDSAEAAVPARPHMPSFVIALTGARNGLVYGAKVRFPHALVMTLLFHSGSFRKRAEFVFRATKQHAFNLAKFVSIYKTALLFQKTLANGKQRAADTFFAGLVGGWFVFGDRNAVNEQIVLYVVSRVLTSFLPRATPPAPASASSTARLSPSGVPPPPGAPYPKSRPPHPKVFSVYAAVTWGLVMYLFRERRDTLHGGMVNSMQYLYLDSEVWNGVKTLLWRGKMLPWMRNKRNAAEEDSASTGASVGNVLDQVTSPAPDLSSLRSFQPETTTPQAVGEPRAFSSETLSLFKTTGLPPLISQEATGWIVLYIPSATPFVNSSTPHVYSASLALFEQPTLATQLVSKFVTVNKSLFKKLKTAQTHTIGDKIVAAGASLEALCSSVSDKTSTIVLTALLEELASQKSYVLFSTGARNA